MHVNISYTLPVTCASQESKMLQMSGILCFYIYFFLNHLYIYYIRRNRR